MKKTFLIIMTVAASVINLVDYSPAYSQGPDQAPKDNPQHKGDLETVPFDAKYKPTMEELNRLEMFEIGKRPDRAFRLISPVGAKENTEDKAFARLKEAAVKMRADAIIDYQCSPVAEQSSWSGFVKIRAYCNGKAIKWMK